MNETAIKVIGGTAIFGAEFIAIYLEMLTAKTVKEGSMNVMFGMWMLLWMFLAGALVLTGYYLSYLSFRNIWVVTVISIGAILIIEPLLIMLLFDEMPTLGAWVGLVFAVLGILASVLF